MLMAKMGDFIFFFLGIAMLLGAGALGFVHIRRALFWQRAKGRVVDSENEGDRAWPVIEFTDTVGKKIRFTSKSDPETQLTQGDEARVLFNPSEPTQAEVQATTKYVFGALLLAVMGVASTGAGLGFEFTASALSKLFSLPADRTNEGGSLIRIFDIAMFAFVASILTYAAIKIRRALSEQKALRESGREAIGRIVGVASEKDSDGDTEYWLEYTFTTGEHGPNIEHRGKHRIAEDPDLAMMVGQEVTVRYLPDRPKVSDILTLPEA